MENSTINGMEKFANRESESRDINQSLESNSITIIKASAASGITAFIKQKVLDRKKDCICTFIQSHCNVNIFELIETNIINNDRTLNKIAQKINNEKRRTKEKLIHAYIDYTPRILICLSIIGIYFLSYYILNINKSNDPIIKITIAILTLICLIVGIYLKYKLKNKETEKIYSGNFSCIQAEILFHIFSDKYLKDKNVFVIFDKAEHLTESSRNDLIDFIGNNNRLHFSFILTNDSGNISNNIETYAKKYSAKTSIKTKILSFPEPSSHLVKQIGILYGEEITSQEADNIVSCTNKNIYEIIKCFQKIDYLPLADFEKDIILFLHIFNFPLTSQRILELCQYINDVIMYNASEIDNAVNNLEKLYIIGKTYYSEKIPSYILLGTNHPSVKSTLDENKARILFLEEKIFDYLSKIEMTKCCESDLMLAYKLAKKHHSNKLHVLANRLFKIKFLNGEEIEENIIENACLLNFYNERKLLVLYYMSIRSYKKAFEILKNTTVDEDYCFLEAILEERMRSKHASHALINCLKCERENSRKSILLNYLASNFLHRKKLKWAKQLYSYCTNIGLNGRNYGYFLRTVAFVHGEADQLYNEALENFIKNNDEFGKYSTLVNMSYLKLQQKDFIKAKEYLDQAESKLEKYGTHACDILYNMKGLYYLLSDDFFPAQAETFFKFSKSITISSLPKIFASINLAISKIYLKQYRESLNIFQELEQEVENHPLGRIKEVYYANRLFAEFVNNNDLTNVLKKMLSHPDRYIPKITNRLGDIYQRKLDNKEQFNPVLTPEDLRNMNLFSPCGAVYWYADPLKVIDFKISFRNQSLPEHA